MRRRLRRPALRDAVDADRVLPPETPHCLADTRHLPQRD
jgi:hypothetical protein